MKKLLLTTILALALPIEAIAAEQKEASNTGFFLGAQVGYTHLAARMNTTSNTTPNGLVLDSESNHGSVRSNSFMGGGVIGFLWQLNERFLVGADLEGNWDGLSVTKKFNQNLQDFEYNVRRHFNIIPSFIWGIQAHEALRILFKLGIAASSFEYTVKNNTDSITSKKKQFSIGVAPAIAAMYQINKNFAVTTTATYEFHMKEKAILLGTIDPAIATDNNIIKIRPNNFSLKFGFTYYFN